MIGTAIYHAIGYNVVEIYLIDVDPATLTIAPKATDSRSRRADAAVHAGRPRRAAAARGTHAERALSRAGQPLREGRSRRASSATTARGPTIPTTSTRTSTGASCAPTGCSAPGSTTTTRGRTTRSTCSSATKAVSTIKHYMFDFGSILGSGTQFADNPRSGRRVHRRPRPRRCGRC